jgi:hypothetical protein
MRQYERENLPTPRIRSELDTLDELFIEGLLQ